METEAEKIRFETKVAHEYYDEGTVSRAQVAAEVAEFIATNIKDGEL